MIYNDNNKAVADNIGTVLLVSLIVVTSTFVLFIVVDISDNQCPDNIHANIDLNEDNEIVILNSGNVDDFIIIIEEKEDFEEAEIKAEVIDGESLLNEGIENVLNNQIENTEEALTDIIINEYNPKGQPNFNNIDEDELDPIGILENVDDEEVIDIESGEDNYIILTNQEFTPLFPPGINNVFNNNLESVEDDSEVLISLDGGDGFLIEDINQIQLEEDQRIQVIGIKDNCEKLLFQEET